MSKLLLAFFLSSALCSFAKAEESLGKPYEWLAFQANALGVFQRGGETFTGQVAWIPYTLLSDNWGARFELGLTLLKSVTGGRFFATNYELFLDYWVWKELVVEAGGGLASWIGNGGTRPMATVYVVGILPNFPERLFVAYSHFFLSDFPANEIKVGAGFHF